jgi:HlyD family secretion protein
MTRLLHKLVILVVLVGLVVVVTHALGVTPRQLIGNNEEERQDIVVARAVVETGDLTVTVSATGSVAPARQVPLAFELSAPVIEVLVETGDVVSAGDVLARLDTFDYEAAVLDARSGLELQQLAFDALIAPPRDVDVAVAEAALRAAQASYNAAAQSGPDSGQVEIARLQAELARNQLWQSQLQRDLSGAGTAALPGFSADDLPAVITDNVPQDDLDNALENLNTLLGGFGMPVNPLQSVQTELGLTTQEYSIDIADANFAAILERGPDLSSLNSANAARIQAQIALNRLQDGASEHDRQLASIELQRAQLAVEQAELVLRRAQLIAPFDGVIAQNNLRIGQPPPVESPAMLVMDTSSYIVELPVDETEIVNVREGQRVQLILDALPDAQIGGIVEKVALTPTRIGQLVTYLVQVRLDPTEHPVRASMSATARIATQELTDVLLVPNRFVRIDRTTQTAFVTIERDDGRYEEVQVELGVRNEMSSQVLSGVDAGQRIVLLPRATLIPGVN